MMNESNKSKPNEKFPPLVKLVKEGIDTILNISEILIKEGQNTIDFYLSSKSKEIDKLIVDLEKSGLGTYAAGEVGLAMDADDEFHLEGDFYFKTSNGDWVKKSLKGKSIKLSWSFLPDEQEKLRRAKRISYDYERPQENLR